MKQTIKNILADIKVELGDKFDLNFDRQGFFHTRWQRSRRAEKDGGLTLVKSGKLRKSVKVSRTADSITFGSSLVYAAIHNEGGVITKKSGAKIRMPKRQFLGYSPEVERTVGIIIENNVKEYMDKLKPDKK